MGKSMKKAIYPGSFDPITNGHIDIINRASALFDKLIIAVASNKSKESLLSKNERVEILRDSLSENSKVEIDSFEGLLVDYAKKKNIFTIVRGLRTLSDFEYEFRMAIMNRNLDKSIETIFLMTDEKYSHISSSSIKEVYTLGGDISPFVPKPVVRNLNKIDDEKNNK
tara:strand:- start:238 stop:741 length:504 start_codon:yes stop_codon:yes gene_type:complete